MNKYIYPIYTLKKNIIKFSYLTKYAYNLYLKIHFNFLLFFFLLQFTVFDLFDETRHAR